MRTKIVGIFTGGGKKEKAITEKPAVQAVSHTTPSEQEKSEEIHKDPVVHTPEESAPVSDSPPSSSEKPGGETGPVPDWLKIESEEPIQPTHSDTPMTAENIEQKQKTDIPSFLENNETDTGRMDTARAPEKESYIDQKSGINDDGQMNSAGKSETTLSGQNQSVLGQRQSRQKNGGKRGNKSSNRLNDRKQDEQSKPPSTDVSDTK